jgi:hypothetical protein
MGHKAGWPLLAGAVFLLVCCSSPTPGVTPTRETTATGAARPGGTTVAPEYPVTIIPLTGPLANRHAEISGLAWYGDTLILLPQYPSFAASRGDGAIFALAKADLLAFLDGTTSERLQPLSIPFVAPGLAQSIEGYEGYEAIAFSGEQVFVTVEARTGGGMQAVLVAGAIAPDLSELVLDPATAADIEAQSGVLNMSDEALFIAGHTVVTMYEANGLAVNPSPIAHRFDSSLVPLDTISFPSIEYRVTDVTSLDSDSRFWAMNYFYPGEPVLLPETDPLAQAFGQGQTHRQVEHVERLVEFSYGESGIRLLDRPPIQFELLPDDARNWEGVVRLDDRGFLIVTDKHPETLLGFVALPD